MRWRRRHDEGGIALQDGLTGSVRPTFKQRVIAVCEDAIPACQWLAEQGRKDGYSFSQLE